MRTRPRTPIVGIYKDFQPRLEGQSECLYSEREKKILCGSFNKERGKKKESVNG